MKIEKLNALPDLSTLLAESEQEGFRFLRRLVNDYDSNINRFAAAGEALFAVFDAEQCIAIGGVNQNPLGDKTVGRVRRVYVSSSKRGQRIGQMLMNHIEDWSRKHFQSLELFTDTQSASRFYESLGYTRVDIDKVSHTKQISHIEGDRSLRNG